MKTSNMYKLVLLAMIVSAQSLIVCAQGGEAKKYKCMIQMTNYTGEGAYLVISLVNGKGAYEKTLYVLGSDKKWYKTLKEWHKANVQKPASISAITGASVSGGDRSVMVIEIEDGYVNKGFSIRFESAVEDQKYYTKDLEVPLTTENLSAKIDGTGFIRYVRLIPN